MAHRNNLGVVIATALHVAMLLQATTMAAGGVADDAGSSAADALLSFAIEQSLANYGALSGPAIWMMCVTNVCSPHYPHYPTVICSRF